MPETPAAATPDHGDAVSALLAVGAPLQTCPGYLTGTGTVYVPEMLAEHLRPLFASVDWARVFSSTGQLDPAAAELRAAARYARQLAEQCEQLAETADRRRADAVGIARAVSRTLNGETPTPPAAR